MSQAYQACPRARQPAPQTGVLTDRSAGPRTGHPNHPLRTPQFGVSGSTRFEVGWEGAGSAPPDTPFWGVREGVFGDSVWTSQKVSNFDPKFDQNVDTF
jgi:hypothetical protein